ncbi:MAG: hypothetical protein QOE22_16 [Candidatus Parcubacteria bacterium]|jgi:hypothetical protein|nr:hypothetical protein [Candidatus Parcubacteria bacterium]
MTKFGWLVLSGVVVAALGIALLVWGFARQSSPQLVDDNLTPVVDPTTTNILTNGEYGFTIQYPATASIEDSFSAESEFPWRANVIASGTPIVRLVTTGGEVRVGASQDRRAIEGCEEKGPSEEPAGSEAFGNADWQAFTFDELGTDDERRVTSYRTLRDGHCFAVEAYEPLAGVPDAAPTERADFIARSFTFAR